MSFFLFQVSAQAIRFEVSEKKCFILTENQKHKKVGFHQIKIVQSAIKMYTSALISSMLLRGLCRHCHVMPPERKKIRLEIYLINSRSKDHSRKGLLFAWLKILWGKFSIYFNKSLRSNLVIAPSTATYFHDFCSQDKNLYNFIPGKIYSLLIKCRFKQLNQLTNIRIYYIYSQEMLLRSGTFQFCC